MIVVVDERTGLPRVIVHVVAAGPFEVVAKHGEQTRVVERGIGPAVFTDPLAPLGEQVTYSDGASDVMVRVPGTKAHWVASPDRRQVAQIRRMDSGYTRMDTGHQVIPVGNPGWVAARDTPIPDTYQVEALTKGTDTDTFDAIVRAPVFVLLHDHTACDLAGCDFAPAVTVTATRVTSQRAPYRDVARRTWSIECAHVMPVGQVAAGIWGDLTDGKWSKYQALTWASVAKYGGPR